VADGHVPDQDGRLCHRSGNRDNLSAAGLLPERQSPDAVTQHGKKIIEVLRTV